MKAGRKQYTQMQECRNKMGCSNPTSTTENHVLDFIISWRLFFSRNKKSTMKGTDFDYKKRNVKIRLYPSAIKYFEDH